MLSEFPRLDVFEALTKWGEVRLRPQHLENVINVELKEEGREEWKPLLCFIAIGGKIAMRVLAAGNDRVLVYDATTNSFSNLASKAQVRNVVDIRSSEAGQDDNDRENDSKPEVDPRD